MTIRMNKTKLKKPISPLVGLVLFVLALFIITQGVYSKQGKHRIRVMAQDYSNNACTEISDNTMAKECVQNYIEKKVGYFTYWTGFIKPEVLSKAIKKHGKNASEQCCSK